MDPEMIFDFVKHAGFLKKKDILGHFSDHNKEIVTMQLTYLTDKKQLGHIQYAVDDTHGDLYFVPYIRGT